MQIQLTHEDCTSPYQGRSYV